jgi:hypothetical protein
MRLPNNISKEDLIDAFLVIRGKTLGGREDMYYMDVGNPDVVFNPIWSRGYGNKTALYTPKTINPKGPIETWWS